MLLFIPLFMFLTTSFCQNYVPGMTRNPSSFLRPPLFRFKRPPPKNFNMESSPSESNTRLTHPESEPFIPGATAFIGRPQEPEPDTDYTQNHRPHYDNYEFSSSQEEVSPSLDVDTEGENMLQLREGSLPPGLRQENQEEIDHSHHVAPFEDLTSEPEVAPFPEQSGYEDENIHSNDEPQEIINEESVFPQDLNQNIENINSEQAENEEESHVETLEENPEVSEVNEPKPEEVEEVPHSNVNPDYVYEENYVSPPAENHSQDPNNEQDEPAESRSKPEEINPFESFPVEEEVSNSNSKEHSAIEAPGNSESFSSPIENSFNEDQNEITYSNAEPQEKSYQEIPNHFQQEEMPIERELPSKPTFNMRPTRFHQKQREQYERQPSFERPTQEYPPVERREYEDQPRPTRYQYPSFDENSLHKADSFSDTPSRIISSPKIKNHKNQETKKRRRPYKPYVESTPSPYEDANLLADYPLYEDENENNEPDRLTLLLQQTKFNCMEKNDGYYADEGLGCEVFHFCQDKVRHSWLCPSGASFHQVHLICMPQSDDNICEKSSNFHFVNDYLYKEAPESTGRNRSYVQRYYPKGYEGGIAILEERQSISQNPALHQEVPRVEREQYRTPHNNNQRTPPRNYHPQHNVQAHESAPVVRQQPQNDVPAYDPRPRAPPPQENRYPPQQQHYDVNPTINTRQDSIPFANNPTQGHIRRPQEIFSRPGASFRVNEHETGLVKRAPSFHRRLGPAESYEKK